MEYCQCPAIQWMAFCVTCVLYVARDKVYYNVISYFNEFTSMSKSSSSFCTRGLNAPVSVGNDVSAVPRDKILAIAHPTDWLVWVCVWIVSPAPQHRAPPTCVSRAHAPRQNRWPFHLRNCTCALELITQTTPSAHPLSWSKKRRHVVLESS